jgi:hypothetical protein
MAGMKHPTIASLALQGAGSQAAAAAAVGTTSVLLGEPPH